MRSGTKHLRIASAIQLLYGVGVTIATSLLVGAAEEIPGDPENALLLLILTYAGYGLHILAGIVGLLLAGKKSVLTVIFGIALFIPQLFYFFHVANDVPLILLNVAFLALPYYYLHNAYKNFKA